MRQNSTKLSKNSNLISKDQESKKVRVYNPITDSYYQIRQKSNSAGRKGTIVSKWSEKAK